MASYFEIFDDKENKAGPSKPQTRKQTRSVLGEISQNTTRRSKRITTSEGCQVFPVNSHSQENKSKPQHRDVVICKKENYFPGHSDVANYNKENSFLGHPIDKRSSQAGQKCRVPFSVIVETSDDKTDEPNRDSESSVSGLEDSNAGSVFSDTSKDEEAAQPLTEKRFNDEAAAQPPTEAAQPPTEKRFNGDFLAVPEYSPEIYKFLKDRESQAMPKWNYMERQTDMTYSMRAILVDWLVEVAEEYKLNSETIHLAVSYIDRFLSRMSVERCKLQLLGTACMFIAAKYEEIYPPGVGEFAFITDNTYTNKQVLRMEHLVLKVLGFDLSAPTSHYFVKHYCQMFSMEAKALHLSLYLNELSLLDGATFLKFPPSLKAASSVVLARHTLGMEAWNDAMAGVAGYTLDDLKECVVGLYEIFVAAPELDQKAVREKYKHGRFACVAQVNPVDIM